MNAFYLIAAQNILINSLTRFAAADLFSIQNCINKT